MMFVNKESCLDKKKSSVSKRILYQHITFFFRISKVIAQQRMTPVKSVLNVAQLKWVLYLFAGQI